MSILETDDNALTRLSAYIVEAEGGHEVDMEQIAVDLIAVSKSTGESKASFMENISEIWDNVEAWTLPRLTN